MANETKPTKEKVEWDEQLGGPVVRIPDHIVTQSAPPVAEVPATEAPVTEASATEAIVAVTLDAHALDTDTEPNN